MLYLFLGDLISYQVNLLMFYNVKITNLAIPGET